MAELQRDLDRALTRIARQIAGSENPAAEPFASEVPGTEPSRSHDGARISPRTVPSLNEEPQRLSEKVRARLPWRSLADGTPISMDVVVAGITQADGARPAGTPFVVVVADSWDAADAIQEALHPIGGLDDAEWVAGWTRSDRGFREITIFPAQDLAA